MDFITGLPPSQGKTVIMVVVDRLSKAAHFVGMARRFTATSVAQHFVKEICRLHGIPRSIVSDRDPIFVSSFWTELWTLSGTTLKHSSSYHPETDGQSEIVNKGVEQYLRSFCMDQPAKWMRFLPWAEYSYNSATHSATKVPPFLVVYGRLPPAVELYDEEKTNNAAAHELLQQRTKIMQDLRNNLREAQLRAKQLADQTRRDVQFQVGDRVLVRLQPYRQVSLVEHSFSKLRRRFYGPFSIIKKVGNVAYKLALPANPKLHNVFHVSKLKLFREDSTLHPDTLPQESIEGRPLITPLAIIRKRWILGRNRDTLQYLVQWAGRPVEEASWMTQTEFTAAYPNSDLEDNVVLSDGSNVVRREQVYSRRKQYLANASNKELETGQMQVQEPETGTDTVAGQPTPGGGGAGNQETKQADGDIEEPEGIGAASEEV